MLTRHRGSNSNTGMENVGMCSLFDPNEIDVFFFSAVFGSYLRPDLVPANPSFFEGSSMGTISTSSIFVSVGNKTERYSVYFAFMKTLCVDLWVECVVYHP